MAERHSIEVALTECVGKDYLFVDEPLKHHMYTQLGGKADYFVTPTTIEAAQAVVKYANTIKTDFTLLGNGSNLIVRDGGIRGIVMSLKYLNEITHENDLVIARSGARIIDVSYYALEQSLSGLEFACGIPGTVGGALYMNAGAYGGEIKDCLKEAVVLNQEGERLTLSADELALGYRTSNIPDRKYIVLEARFQLKSKEQSMIKDEMDDLTERRESKQPLEYPSCGSVFKRPPGYFAGKLIQDANLQGKGIGGAEVSTKHAGFIVNKNHATAKDYIDVIEMVQKEVKEKYNVELEREVRIIGEE
ncbi:UDP-N-acetylmuramate dehydrogenase [Pelagirhabdus alkalitolerans]|uniref:UDP-N-acetylenolpyruvoylglucosamine reductase n=1 Tax=Pelagirhabdus alkalitolerans TaxID=1612202 RepID=A0A1G6JJQ9_9BACI|nr:UDP-N-acetylmuramate dehydrogenase [Pelagirhabdus alkalitolerans]SDC18685.1 UDP-N-acetylmuramate dehydrogenase [Pelagirhabdus alkalitolerans]